MNRLMMLLAAGFAALGAWASTEKVGDYTWSYEVYESYVSIVKGENQAAVSPKPTGSVTIPDKLGGLPVTRIGQSAFYGCSGMTGVAIPDTVTYIGMKAFSGCSKLSILELPYKVDTIEMDALSGCTSLKTLCLSKVNFAGKAISTIVNLSDCPASMEVRYCGKYTLDDRGRFWCYYQLIFGKSGSISLWRGTELKNIKSRSAYGSMYSDTSVTIPSELYFSSDNSRFKVTSIGSYAFKNHEMTSVTIPSTVTNIGSYAFVGCKLASVAIPDSVKCIGQSAFKGCTSLESVTTGDGVESIRSWAFVDCTSLESVTFGSSVRTIADAAFYGCTALENVVIPAGVTYIDGEAFDCCSGLKSFTVASGNTEYKSVSGLLLTKDGTTLVQGVNGSVTIPNGVKIIGYSAFYELANLNSVTIPEGVEIIGDYAFGGCYMQFVDIPASVTGIGECAFYSCPDLIDATIRSRVADIGSQAFSGCSSLTDVYLPKSFAGKIADDALPSGATIKYLEAYTIRFHRNDASDEKTESREFDYGVSTRIPSLSSLGWARRGCDFLGWATSRANADAGKVWKKDWAAVSSPVAAGKTLDAYAVWALKPNSYAIQFIRNDGAGTWRTVGFNYGEKTRMPSLANGLGWARRGYAFKGWALTTADANAGKVWKGDWAYVSTPVAAGKVLTAYAVWELKPGFYQIRFNKNDGSGKWRALGFECGVPTKLPSIAALGWKREGHSFDFWASSKANADAGYMWRNDGETVSSAAAEGKTLSVYAVWDYDWPWEGGPSTWD